MGVVVAKARTTKEPVRRLQPLGKRRPTVQARNPHETIEIRVCPMLKPSGEPVSFQRRGV
jgi:hypothetical protein